MRVFGDSLSRLVSPRSLVLPLCVSADPLGTIADHVGIFMNLLGDLVNTSLYRRPPKLSDGSGNVIGASYPLVCDCIS